MSTSPAVVVADRYRLVAPLGQGGMGRVWRATDVVLHREVAIKELVPPPGLTPEERQEMRERSLREARAIARLNNINVVRIFDVLRTDGDPWIVMEYVPSRSLQDTLASDGPFSAVRAAEIGLGVLNALRAAHRNGVVHRDVKPGNVLIGAEGRVVLTDFGLATVPGDPNVTRTGLVLGSPAYIAPERARDGTAGPAADLWSLGATLYAAVEGSSPFARPSAIATLAALATENPPPARNAGPLKPVLNGLLRKDPAHRINAEEAERLLLRAAGRRSKMAFSMNPAMRRPGVGRERPALPGPPPVVPGRPASGSAAVPGTSPAGSAAVPGTSPAGSAPVVPGPRPPIVAGRPSSGSGENRPPVVPGRPAEGRTPVFTPGKATVGRAPRPAERNDRTPVQKLDATRVDTPPVRDNGPQTQNQDQSSTGAKSTQQPGGSGTGAPAAGPVHGALARGTRGVFGAIAPGAAGQRRRAGDQNDAERPATTRAAGQAGVPRPASERSAVENAKAGNESANRAAAERESADRAAAERESADRAAAERESADRAAAERESADRAAAERESADRAAAERAEAERLAREQAAAQRAAEERAAVETAAAQRAAAEREALERAAAQWMAREKAAADKVAAERAAAERAAAERAAEEKAAAERAAAERAAREKAVAVRAAAERAAAETAAAEMAVAEKAAERAAAETAAAEMAVAEKVAERAAAETAAAETAVAEKAVAEKAAEEKAAEKAAAEEAAAEKAAPGKAATEKPAAEKAAAEKAAADRAAAGKAAAEKATTRKTTAERAAAIKAAAERAAVEKAAADRVDAEKAAEQPAVAQSAAESVAAAWPVVESAAAETAPDEPIAAEKGDEAGKPGENRAAKPEGVVGATASDRTETESAEADQAKPAQAGGDRARLGKAGGDRARLAKAGGDRAQPVKAGATKGDEGHAGEPERVAEQKTSKTAGSSTAAPDAKAATESHLPTDAEAGQPCGAEFDQPLARRSVTDAKTGADKVAGEDGAEADDTADAKTGADETADAKARADETADAKARANDTADAKTGADETADEGETAGETADEAEDETALGGEAADKTSVVPGGVLANVPAFGGPARPAWQPIELRGRTSPKGLTVFGTTLTRRQTVIAGAIVLALVLIVLVVIVPKAFGDSSNGAAGKRTGNQTGALPATSAKPSSSPATKAATQTPSSAPSHTGVNLPAGWYLYKDQTGFSVPVPRSWSVRRQGTEVYFQENGGQYRLLIVDQTNHPKPDPRADWQNQESQRVAGYRNYHRIGITAVSYWDKAADWEFTRTSDNGNPLHVVKRGFITAPDLAYGITWSTSDGDWDANKANLDLIYHGFVPARS